MAENRTILAIDPSSTRTGYAVIRGLDAHDLVEAGVFKPRQKDPYPDRVDTVTADATAKAIEHEPSLVVIEIPDGRVFQGGRAGGGRGQSVYGYTVGYMVASLSEVWANPILKAETNVWTGNKPKAIRAAGIAAMYPQYEPSKDKGMDIADAIGLARWGWTESEVAHD